MFSPKDNGHKYTKSTSDFDDDIETLFRIFDKEGTGRVSEERFALCMRTLFGTSAKKGNLSSVVVSAFHAAAARPKQGLTKPELTKFLTETDLGHVVRAKCAASLARKALMQSTNLAV